MTRGIKIDVGDGWAAIVLNIIVVGSAYPERWNFRFHRAWRNCGRMRIHVTTDADEIEAVNATVAFAEIAWHRSGMTCEVCGRGVTSEARAAVCPDALPRSRIPRRRTRPG